MFTLEIVVSDTCVSLLFKNARIDYEKSAFLLRVTEK